MTRPAQRSQTLQQLREVQVQRDASSQQRPASSSATGGIALLRPGRRGQGRGGAGPGGGGPFTGRVAAAAAVAVPVVHFIHGGTKPCRGLQPPPPPERPAGAGDTSRAPFGSLHLESPHPTPPRHPLKPPPPPFLRSAARRPGRSDEAARHPAGVRRPVVRAGTPVREVLSVSRSAPARNT